MANARERTEAEKADVRTGVSVAALKQAFQENLYFIQAKFPSVATRIDHYMALALTVRDRVMHRWVHTAHTYYSKAPRSVGYLSAEYLLGPQLANQLACLGIEPQAREAMSQLGLDLDALIEIEPEPGLGNGGLGRLAACYLDSLATLQIPAIGYGLRYEFGIFQQVIRDGRQYEQSDKWLRYGNPWEIPRPEIAFTVGFGGSTRTYFDEQGRLRVEWRPEKQVMGVAYDTPIPGFRNQTVNLLRLWRAQAVETFDFQAFNVGDYFGAVDDNIESENISKVLYPNDEPPQGKVLRLQQQYFFVSCALRDMIRMFCQRTDDLDLLYDKFTVQLNDTHPTIAIPELMRLLIDEHGMDWERAWEIVRKTFAFTNHTLLPEALEVWPVEQFRKLLPRHLEIIFEINRRFLESVKSRFGNDEERIRRMSLIDESAGRSVRMAHLACVGCHSVNGVAELHSRLVREHLFPDFFEMEPGKFRNITNGVTPRRFLLVSNPGLSGLISRAIGDRWPTDLDELRRLEPLANDPAFQQDWRNAKLESKRALAALVKERAGIIVDPQSMFDVQAKRIHEYKRQHLNVLRVIASYLEIKDRPTADRTPRTVLFAGKAAPGYFIAKLIIQLIHAVADLVNHDADAAGKLRVAFIPDFNVKVGQRLYPAADLSEQISTAGKEASGTGNMKFALNGALTIGTLDGANIEIRREVGEENFFAFGMTAEEVVRLRSSGYSPRSFVDHDPMLARAIDFLSSRALCGDDSRRFQPLADNLLNADPFFVLADFGAYFQCQSAVDAAFDNRNDWTAKSILNVARMGLFSSDRSIRQYCDEIWQAKPTPIDLSGSLS